MQTGDRLTLIFDRQLSAIGKSWLRWIQFREQKSGRTRRGANCSRMSASDLGGSFAA
jgi:hypothetical protein